MGKSSPDRYQEEYTSNTPTLDEPAPELAERISPTFHRNGLLSFYFDTTAQKAYYNRPCQEFRTMRAVPTETGQYQLRLEQHFNFLDHKSGANDSLKQTTSLPDYVNYDDAITIIKSAMAGWKNIGFATPRNLSC